MDTSPSVFDKPVSRPASPVAAPDFLAAVERALAAAVAPPDEARLDPCWSAARASVAEFALRPGKRIRPWLVATGWALGGGSVPAPEALATFAAAVELLHAFVLVHDDVADHAHLRRGGPTLHRALADLGPGADLAVVAGDHLFARALELMLSAELAGAARAARHYLAVCRHTAVGQFLDLSLPHRRLEHLTPIDALRVARLKTARYTVAAPLACGAILARAPDALVRALERVGGAAGLAFQLRDDLLGLGVASSSLGKPATDLEEGKRTYPFLVAWRRASPEERRLLEALRPGGPRELADAAREIVVRRGGVRATEAAIARCTRAARRAAAALPVPRDAAAVLSGILERLANREV